MGKTTRKALLPDLLAEWSYTGHSPFLVCPGAGRRALVGALVILMERVRRAMLLSASQRRAPRRTGKVWSLRKSHPLSQTLPLEGPGCKIWIF